MWDKLPKENKDEYKNFILAFASLTEAFAQKADGDETPSPIINSKYQETVFQKAFNATAEDIGNSSFDASILLHNENAPDEKYIVGIKTFGISSDSAQKIAQFKKQQQKDWLKKIEQLKENAKGLATKEEVDKVNHDAYLELAKCISEIRNARIRSSVQQLRGFECELDENDTEFSVSDDHVDGDKHMHAVYHTLQPSPKGEEPKIYVREDSYNTIDIDNIIICGCTSPKNPANFEFEDGQHRYKYTPADSQLYMDFQKAETMDVWNVIYVEDAYKIFEELGHNIYASSADTKHITEEYIWPIVVHPYSGFNSFYGTGSKLGTEGKTKRLLSLDDKYAGTVSNYNMFRPLIERYLLSPDITRNEKETLRTEIVQTIKTSTDKDFVADVIKLLYRPVNEIYIPIPSSARFHTQHPDFFGENIGNQILAGNNEFCKNNPFSLIFEPSGNVILAFITQDNGKAIQSINKQSILGVWILKGVFQLKDYEQLTQDRLDELEINALRLYKTSESNDVHIEFTYVEPENMPDPLVNLRDVKQNGGKE